MAFKTLCQLLVALCVVGYASAVISGKAVRLVCSFPMRDLIFCLYVLALYRALRSPVAQVSGRLSVGTIPSVKPYPASIQSDRFLPFFR